MMRDLSRRPRQGYRFVYALRCPVTKLFFYVGSTSQSPRARLSLHISNAKLGKRKLPGVSDWIRLLLRAGLRPQVFIVGTFKGFRAERNAIDWLDAADQPLTNIQARYRRTKKYKEDKGNDNRRIDNSDGAGF